MPLNVDAVGFVSAPVEVTWSSKDALLYAVGVGAGALDPTGFELEFTTENSEDVVQRVLPTFPVVLSGGQGIYAALGTFDRTMLVHGEQAVALDGALPVEGTAESVTTLTGVYDKGSGALVVTETVATEASTGRRLWATTSSAFIRGEGGWGGDRGPSQRFAVPDRPADHTVVYPTRSDQALLYRLSGDRNPLHSDPRFAARAGFERPILHGLCTFGFAGRAVLHACCGSDPDRFGSMTGRFSKPVFPGEALTVAIWEEGEGSAVFQTATPAGIVIDGGRATYR